MLNTIPGKNLWTSFLNNKLQNMSQHTAMHMSNITDHDRMTSGGKNSPFEITFL